MLTSLSHYCNVAAASGLKKIEYLPIDFIDFKSYHYLTHQGKFIGTILLNDGDWLTALYEHNKNLFSEDQKGSDHNPFYSPKYSMTLPFLKAAVTEQFHLMANRRFLVRYTDTDGKRWLSGTYDSGLRFSHRKAGGSTGGNSARYNVGIEGNSPVPTIEWPA